MKILLAHYLLKEKVSIKRKLLGPIGPRPYCYNIYI